jgi:hypothetical protein
LGAAWGGSARRVDECPHDEAQLTASLGGWLRGGEKSLYEDHDRSRDRVQPSLIDVRAKDVSEAPAHLLLDGCLERGDRGRMTRAFVEREAHRLELGELVDAPLDALLIPGSARRMGKSACEEVSGSGSEQFVPRREVPVDRATCQPELVGQRGERQSFVSIGFEERRGCRNDLRNLLAAVPLAVVARHASQRYLTGWQEPGETLPLMRTERRFAKNTLYASADARRPGSASNFDSNFFHAAARFAGTYSVGQKPSCGW